MKNMIKKSALVLALSMLATAQCWAGWGAIACSANNGACTWADGQADYQIAVDLAVNRCNEEYGNCSLSKWEHNECASVEASNGNVAEACN